MRGKRSKQYRKQMQQYGMHFGFREPYQVLVDDEILQDASKWKMDFTGGLEKTLHGTTKPMITQCCIRHLYAAEPKDETLIEHAKGFERRRCNHHTLEKPLSTLECIASVVDGKENKTNKHRYVVATQDGRLRAYLRGIPGVPLIHLKRSVMIMEPMASATDNVRRKEEMQKLKSGLRNIKGESKTGAQAQMIDQQEVISGQQVGPALSVGQSTGEEIPAPKRRKRGPSGPNPLSMLKSKKKQKINIGLETGSNTAESMEAAQVTAATSAVAAIDATAKAKRKRKHASAKINIDTNETAAPSKTPTISFDTRTHST